MRFFHGSFVLSELLLLIFNFFFIYFFRFFLCRRGFFQAEILVGQILLLRFGGNRACCITRSGWL